MPPWSFPAVVKQVEPPHISATIDLGCRLYTDTLIRVVDLNANTANMQRLTALLPAGTRILATCEGISGTSIRAHVTLVDGQDVASVVRRRNLPATPQAAYGGTLDKQWTYPAVVEKLTDADTFLARADLGLGDLRYRVPVRVAHCNAPEKDTAEGQAALVWAERVITPGMEVTLRAHSLEKFGRLLASVLLPEGHDYSRDLIDAGHARPYEGGAR